MNTKQNNGNSRRQGEQGTVLVATLLFLLALGVLATALVFTVQNEMRASTAYRRSQQAFYVANAGIQRAVQWFAGTYVPHIPSSDYDMATLPVRYSGNDVVLAGQTGSTSAYPESSVAGAFAAEFSNRSLQADERNFGSYAVNATLLKHRPATFIDPATFNSYASAVERWRIISIGYWGNFADPLGIAQITGIIENSGNALFDRALWGIDSVDLGGTVLIDSYDPDLGPYGGTNIGNNGAIGTNGSVTADGTVDIHGDMAYGPSGTYNLGPNSRVYGDIIHLQQPRYFPPIPAFSVGTTNLNIKKGTTTIGPGQYGNVVIGANGTLALQPGVYYFDSLTESSTGTLTISGDTTIFVKSSLDLSGQGVINPLGDPTKLTVYYSGTSRVDVTGGSSAFLEMYAPNADMKLVGTSDFFGSFIGKTVTIQGTPDVHFDEGCLDDNLVQRPFRLINWSQNVY